MNGHSGLAQRIKVCLTQHLGSRFLKVHTTRAVNDDLSPSDDWLVHRIKPLPYCYKTV